jgi:hypothetical protein
MSLEKKSRRQFAANTSVSVNDEAFKIDFFGFATFEPKIAKISPFGQKL